MKKIKNLVSYLLAGTLMITFICIALLIVVRFNLLSVNGIMRSCDISKYYEKVKYELIDQAYYEGIPYGIDKKCLENVFLEEKIRLNIKSTLNAQVKNKKKLIQTDEIISGIKANVTDKYGSLDNNKEISLDSYIMNVCKIYEKKMELPGSEYLSRMMKQFVGIAKIGIFVCILILLFCGVVLVAIRRYGHQGLRYVAYGELGSGLTLIVFSTALVLSGIIDGFDISSELLNELLIVHLKNQLYLQIFAGIILLLISFITIWIVSKQRKRLVQ